MIFVVFLLEEMIILQSIPLVGPYTVEVVHAHVHNIKHIHKPRVGLAKVNSTANDDTI